MSQRILQTLLIIASCFYVATAAAADHSIHIEWGYTAPSDPEVSGFKLYQEGTAVCETQNPYATSMDCSVSLEQDTTSFTLTALFDDGSESPHSDSFPFTVADPDPDPDPEIVSKGSHAFTFTWETSTSTEQINEYRVYLNDSLLCNSYNTNTNSINCNTDIVDGLMTFTMTTVDADEVESNPSNVLTFDPNDYPDLFDIQEVTFSWQYDSSEEITGFNIYQDDELLCETSDTTTRELTCTSNLANSATTFSVTAVNSDGTETTLTSTITYEDGSTSEPTELLATITTNVTEGTAPLTVSYDSFSSTGDIASYVWSFGDGDSSSVSNVDHTFVTSGTYETTLTITDNSGNISSDSVTIIVSPDEVANEAPTAIISAATTGATSIAISFNGSNSSDSDGSISSYLWDFGDGSSASGQQASHAFEDAATYTVTLTVTDNQGATHTTTTHITITELIDDENQAPQASITTVTATSGKAPLTVSFSAEDSTDSDGTIETYSWNFGDGSSASGISATHTYTTEATYTAILQVTDDKGLTSITSTTITVEPADEDASFAIEIGEVIITGSWTTVELEKSFSDPIVITGPPSCNGGHPGVVQLRNIGATSFQIRFDEWDYLDGPHSEETTSFLVIEKGHHNVNGTAIEAGTITGTTTFTSHNFTETFEEIPVVLTSIATINETDTISGRIKDITTTGFSYYFREQEANTNTHADETVNYIALQPGSGAIGTITFEAGQTADAVKHSWYNVAYQSAGGQLPFLLADMQTTDGTDTSTLRFQNSTTEGFEIKVEEEKSANDEVSHTSEVIGYLALTSAVQTESTAKLVTFNWEFPADQEDNISGFKMYVNDELACEETDVSSRSISCVINQADTYAFEMTAVTLTEEETNLSNQIQFTQ